MFQKKKPPDELVSKVIAIARVKDMIPLRHRGFLSVYGFYVQTGLHPDLKRRRYMAGTRDVAYLVLAIRDTSSGLRVDVEEYKAGTWEANLQPTFAKALSMAHAVSARDVGAYLVALAKDAPEVTNFDDFVQNNRHDVEEFFNIRSAATEQSQAAHPSSEKLLKLLKILEQVREMEIETLLTVFQGGLRRIMEETGTEIHPGESWFIAVMMSMTTSMFAGDKDMAPQVLAPLMESASPIDELAEEMSPQSLLSSASDGILILSVDVAFSLLNRAGEHEMFPDTLQQSTTFLISRRLRTYRPLLPISLYIPLVMGGIIASMTYLDKREIASDTLKLNIQLLSSEMERRSESFGDTYEEIVPRCKGILKVASDAIQEPS